MYLLKSYKFYMKNMIFKMQNFYYWCKLVKLAVVAGCQIDQCSHDDQTKSA